MLLLLLACGAEKPATVVGEDSAAPVATAPMVPDLPPPECLDHDYQPLDEMGEILSFQAAPELSYTSEQLAELLDVLDHPELGPITWGVDAWRVRYRTQDRGAPAEATGLVVLPRRDGQVPLLVWHHATVGVADLCAPTATGALGVGLALVWAGRLGAAVAAPDYLGLEGYGAPGPQMHPFMVHEPVAISSLDMARAALRLAEQEGTDAAPDPSRTLLWGLAQGGHAALWSDRYASGYAPELDIVATVAAVPPTDVVMLAEHGLTTWSPTSELLAAVLATHADWYGLDIEQALPGVIDTRVLDELEDSCNVLDAGGGADTLEELFSPTVIDAVGEWGVTIPDWACALRANRVAQTEVVRGHDAPVMVVLGEADDLVPPGLGRDDMARLCEQGVAVALVECAETDHDDAAFGTLDRQVRWIEDRIDGVALEDACALPAPLPCPELR